jgi:hypothetical protein
MPRKLLACCVCAGFVLATTGTGCNDSTSPPVTKAPLLTAPDSKELPKSPKQGGGPTSSGNSKKNPGASS